MIRRRASRRARPTVAEVLRPRPEEALEGADGIATAAPVVAPALVVGAVATFFIPVLDRFAPLVAVGLLTLTPAVLSLAWRPGGLAGRARNATVITAIFIALAAGGLGLLANPCVADPIVTGLVSAALFTGTLLFATWIGRSLAIAGHLVWPIVAAGVIGFGGFFGSLLFVGGQVFVLC